MQINYIQHEEIDKSSWDKTIKLAVNGNLYAYSWYLDVVCPDWNALISPDYNMIMPLTGNKKYGFHYLYRPMLSQQLGVFSRSLTTKADVGAFLDAIPSKYRLIQYCLNKFNHPEERAGTFLHDSYELKLNADYQNINKKYSGNHRRNIKKAASAGFEIVEGLQAAAFIELLIQDKSPGSTILSKKSNLRQLSELIDKMQDHKAIRIIGINNREGKPVAAVLFGHSHNKWIYLVPVNSKEGKEKRALFVIIDELVQTRAANNEVLDFEGSDIPGLAQFYSGFGAHKIQYSEIRTNTLPWPIKFLK